MPILPGARYREFLEQPLRSRGIKVTVPLEGLRIGEQLARLDGMLRGARAAENDTSVSAMVATYLTSLVRDEATFARLEAQQRRVIAGIERFQASDRLSRDEVHDRALR